MADIALSRLIGRYFKNLREEGIDEETASEITKDAAAHIHEGTFALDLTLERSDA